MERKILPITGASLAAMLVAVLLAPVPLLAADLDTLQSVRHGGVTISEGDAVVRNDLTNIFQTWTFDFSWPNAVSNTRSFFAVFRGTFGDLEGGVPEEGVNYKTGTQPWGIGQQLIGKGIGLPALGDLDTTSATYTVMVAELPTDFAHADAVEWFSSGGVSGVQPVNHTSLTFSYDGSFDPQDLDSIHFITHGGKEISEGETVLRSELSSNSNNWRYNFDWPRAVANQHALFTVFRGTFGDLEGVVPNEGVNYATQLQTWGAANPKDISKAMSLPPLLDENVEDGIYTVVVMERDPKYDDNAAGFFIEDQIEWFTTGGASGIPPLAYASLEFEYSNSDPLDPLLLQYEPVLYLHQDENYQPMNVEAFVEASALWDDNDLFPDSIIEPRGSVTIEDLSVGSSDDWYLAFSSDSAKTFDVSNALSTYNQLVTDGDAVPTYYGYKSEDSFTDDEGVLHEFIVLQYWYFYAFNNWLEHGGFNNHEGDWETVMVFLDKNTEEPLHVAYSSHLNDGEPELLNVTQTGSVRRDWDSNEVEKSNGVPISYVSLGSHANYPNNGDGGVHLVRGIPENHKDITSFSGGHILSSDWFERSEISFTQPAWMSYEGKWGADGIEAGSEGPQGPEFIDTNFFSSLKRFSKPVEWAGIDQVGKKEVFTITKILEFIKQLTTMSFAEDLSTGTEVSVDLHDESISFGKNLDDITLLPHFWDIESSLVSGTFEVEVSFEYDPDEVAALESEEESLGVFLYNEATNLWEQVTSSVVDTVNNIVSFTTTHFSRYAIGVVEVEEEPLTVEELVVTFKQEVDASNAKSIYKRNLKRRIDRIPRLYEKKRYRQVLSRVKSLERIVNNYAKRSKIDKETSTNLLDILSQIRELILKEK